MPKDELKLFACRSGKLFGERIAKELISNGCFEEGLGRYKFREFECGENKQYGFEKSVRDADVYIVQSCTRDNSLRTSVDDNVMELFRFINGMRESSAGRITAVIPMLPYSRQDKIWERGEPHSAKLFAHLIESAGADRIITADLHADQIEGFYRRIKPEHLHASHTFLNVLKREFGGGLREIVFCSTDAGGAALARHYSKKTGGSVALGNKVKSYDERGKDVEKIDIVGDVSGRDVIIPDDMIDTGGSMVRTAEGCKEKGANNIDLLCAHPLFSGPARERIGKARRDGFIRDIYCTDTILHSEQPLLEEEGYKQISIAPLFARVIQKLHKGEGVSEIYLDAI